MINALTIDVEEYFHPTEVQSARGTEAYPPRLDSSMSRVLDMLAEHNCKATCFVLGWVAERHPKIVRKIRAAGHEIGCHSHAHQLVYDLTPQQFQRDTERAVKAISDCCGVSPRVYRAPSYSITQKSLWALETLVELGFTHDSSIYPIKHDRYGIPGFQRHAFIQETPSGPICEVPIATVELFNGTVAPVGGGAYLRLFPYRYTAAGLRRLNSREGHPGCVYFHPWELDPDQPRLNLGMVSRMRTYAGLSGMRGKVGKLLKDFQFSTLTSVYPAPQRVQATRMVAAAAGGA